MIKQFTFGTALAALVAAPAFAGGYVAPVVESEPVVIQTAPAIIPAWTGGYVGANLNYGKGEVKPSSTNTTVGKIKPDGASGAIRGGYDWQMGNGVFGVGAEYNAGKYKDTVGGTKAEYKNMGTIFARAGYAINDNWLAYGMLGYSRAKLEITDGPTVAGKRKDTVDGVMAGIGTEYRFNEKWSGYGEYAYSDLGDTDHPDYKDAKLNQVKLGVNFRF